MEASSKTTNNIFKILDAREAEYRETHPDADTRAIDELLFLSITEDYRNSGRNMPNSTFMATIIFDSMMDFIEKAYGTNYVYDGRATEDAKEGDVQKKDA